MKELTLIEQEFGISKEELTGRSRGDETICDIRHTHWFIMFKKHTQEEIGRIYNRNHSSVCHGIKKICWRIDKEERIRDIHRRLIKVLSLKDNQEFISQ
jgi:chromosomal replication initiation ATPase DnaA